MSRNALPKQTYQVVSQQRGSSKSPHSLDEPMTTIRFRGLSDNKSYPTYIVDSFKNIRQWRDILDRPYEKSFVQFDPGWMYGNNTIDADSKPYLVTQPTASKPAKAKTSAVDVSDIFTASVSVNELPKQITKNFWATIDDSFEYAKPGASPSNDELIFALACQQDPELMALLQKATNVIPCLIDTANNLSPKFDSETWFGYAVFDVSDEDYMLYKLGQSE